MGLGGRGVRAEPNTSAATRDSAPTGQLAAVAARRYAPYPEAHERGPRGPIRELVRTIVLAVRAYRRRQPPPPKAVEA